jgi:hypothetical protein
MVHGESRAEESLLDLEEVGLGEVALLDGERVSARLNANDQNGRRSFSESGALLLTTNRVIHVTGEEDRRQTTMISVQDVESVSVRLIFPEGIGPYVWAALSVVMSLILFSYIEHNIARIAVPLIILTMGAYLIVDRLTARGRPTAIIRARDAEIHWSFNHNKESKQVYEFINALYRQKRQSAYNMDEWLSLH